MAEQLYAIVFNRDFAPGEHWNNNAPADDPDRKQQWRAGDLYSVGTVVAESLPPHLEAIPIDEVPRDARWDRDTRQFIPRRPEEKEAELVAAINRLVEAADVPEETKARVLSNAVRRRGSDHRC